MSTRRQTVEGTIQEPTESQRSRFREWCEAKSDDTHAYTRRKANRRYAQGKDVDRHFIREYDEFSTVLITYCAGTPKPDESIADHSERFYLRPVTRKRRKVLKDIGAFEEYAGISVLAPNTESRVPGAIAPFTHAHDFLWLPGHVDPEAFHPVVEKHVEKVDGATAEQHPLGEAVTVQHHTSGEVETPASVEARGSGQDSERGATTQLSQELGANLPLLTAKYDARGTPEYVETWCAAMRLGSDDSLDTRGSSRFRRLGTFRERSESMKLRRKLREARGNAIGLSEAVDGARGPGTLHSTEDDSALRPTLSAEDDILDLTDRETVGVTRI